MAPLKRRVVPKRRIKMSVSLSEDQRQRRETGMERCRR